MDRNTTVSILVSFILFFAAFILIYCANSFNIQMRALEGEISDLRGTLLEQSKDSSRATQSLQEQVARLPAALSNGGGANSELATRPKKNAFFDLGANKGDSVEQFVGLSKSGLGGEASKSINSIPLKIHGAWDVWMFEVHPVFTEKLYKIKEQVENLDVGTYGGPFHVLLYNNTAIGTIDGTVDIYLDTRSKEVWGSSILKEHPDTNGTMIKVPVKNLNRLIMDNYRIDDHVIVKMDIEGAEFELLEDLLVRGSFPYIDELYVEFHDGIDTHKVKPCLMTLLNYAKKYMHVGNWQ
eukprot:Phypoly_transcript_10044.p1 GENE.Phypoly_transcript_10044~~Phypoly_transcript_10044.p1  ORF type:complete len:296 (+),score=35.91 Phypoly_transcript_10044:447-1334(+)